MRKPSSIPDVDSLRVEMSHIREELRLAEDALKAKDWMEAQELFADIRAIADGLLKTVTDALRSDISEAPSI